MGKAAAPTPVLLPGESQGRGSLVGCRPWAREESDTTEATQQQQRASKLAQLSVKFPRNTFTRLTQE